jgi:hypothetical protein
MSANGIHRSISVGIGAGFLTRLHEKENRSKQHRIKLFKRRLEKTHWTSRSLLRSMITARG